MAHIGLEPNAVSLTLVCLGSGLSFGSRENRLPIVFHADKSPAFGLGFIPGLIEFADRRLAIVSELAFAVVDWQKPHEDAVRAAEPGDVGGAIARLVERYETMGDANVRVLELEGRVPAIDYLLEVSRAGHRAWIERTLLPGVDDEQLVFALYAATDVTLWKLLRRDLGRSQADTEAVVLRLVRGALGEASDRKEQHP